MENQFLEISLKQIKATKTKIRQILSHYIKNKSILMLQIQEVSLNY